MARIRTVKPSFFRHYDLYCAERDTGLPLRIAFAGLWTVADKAGRFEWKPEEIKLDCLPHDKVDFSRVMDALVTRGFILKYEIKGRLYGWIPTFNDHQILNNREKASELPSFEQQYEIKVELTPEPRATHASATRERNGQANREGEGELSSEAKASGADAPDDPMPAIPLSLIRPEGDDWGKALFGPGLDWLCEVAGKPPAKMRSLVGRWLMVVSQDHRALFAVLAEAQDAQIADPVAWVTAKLGGKKNGAKRDDTPDRRAGFAGAFEERYGPGGGGDSADRPEGTDGEAGAHARDLVATG